MRVPLCLCVNKRYLQEFVVEILLAAGGIPCGRGVLRLRSAGASLRSGLTRGSTPAFTAGISSCTPSGMEFLHPFPEGHRLVGQRLVNSQTPSKNTLMACTFSLSLLLRC